MPLIKHAALALLAALLMTGCDGGSSPTLSKQEADHQAAMVRIRAETAKREAEFKAMNPEGHLARANQLLTMTKQEISNSHASSWLFDTKAHLAEVPEKTPGKAAASAEAGRLGGLIKAAEAERNRKKEADKKKEAQIKMLAKETQRRAFAKACEERFLDAGMNCDVTTVGGHAETLRIKWALASKVSAHQISKGDLLQTAKDMAFKKVVLTNGFTSDLGYTVYWDL